MGLWGRVKSMESNIEKEMKTSDSKISFFKRISKFILDSTESKITKHLSAT